MNELTIQDVVSETRELVGGVRRNLVKVMVNLNFLRSKEEVWATHKTFPQYCEEELGLSQPMTSKLLKAHDGWVLKAGVAPEKIEGIDYEKLAGYVPLLEGKDPELALEEVKVWTREDIRAEKKEKVPCEHEKAIIACPECWESFIGITRVEVINHKNETGRAYSFRDDSAKVWVSIQDNGRTLKVFVE